jgi:hypothetical protein
MCTGITEEGFAGESRVKMPCLPPEQVVHNFTEVELGLTDAGAVAEGTRCFQCGVRLQITPAPRAPDISGSRTGYLKEIKTAF